MLCASESQCELIYHFWYFGRWFDLKGLFFSIANGLIISLITFLFENLYILLYCQLTWLTVFFYFLQELFIYFVFNIIIVNIIIIMEYFQAMFDLGVSVSCLNF